MNDGKCPCGQETKGDPLPEDKSKICVYWDIENNRCNLSEITISCPFCGEDDFDLVGLKAHLERHCEVYDETPQVHTIFDNSNGKH